jgi:2-iminobutanoate/2-iminopropanoate deaminase
MPLGTVQAGGERGAPSRRMKKQAVPNPAAPDFGSIFNWGLKIRNFKELFLIAGHAAQNPDFSIAHPGDPVAQTQFILDVLDNYLAENGYGRDDIIRIEFTLTKDVTEDQFNQILGQFVAFFDPVDVKPAAGTLRFVDALAFPGMMVEYEIWCAR